MTLALRTSSIVKLVVEQPDERPDRAGRVVVLGLAEQQRPAALDVAQVDVVAERRADDPAARVDRSTTSGSGLFQIESGAHADRRAGPTEESTGDLVKTSASGPIADLEVLRPPPVLDQRALERGGLRRSRARSRGSAADRAPSSPADRGARRPVAARALLDHPFDRRDRERHAAGLDACRSTGLSSSTAPGLYGTERLAAGAAEIAALDQRRNRRRDARHVEQLAADDEQRARPFRSRDPPEERSSGPILWQCRRSPVVTGFHDPLRSAMLMIALSEQHTSAQGLSSAADGRERGRGRERQSQAVLCFGELLLRLSSPRGEGMLQGTRLDAHFGGAEANVAVALARLGLRSAMVSALPDNAIGDAAIESLRKAGVDTSRVVLAPGRMGLYFLTPSAGVSAGFGDLRPRRQRVRRHARL